MANTSVSGLVSGLDTATIISQLMQIEAQPQTNLRARVSTEQKVVTALQAINAKLAGIATKAGDLAKMANWSPMSATSNNDKVTALAGSSATAATMTFSVDRVATASTLTSDAHPSTYKVLSDGSNVVAFTQPSGSTVDIDTGDGTLQGLAKAINAGNYGATATLIQVSPGSYKLQITSSATGAKTIALGPGSTAATGTTLALTDTFAAGQQAQITVGTDKIFSDTNTFKGLMSGVDVTLQSGATGSATITIGRDTKGISDSVKAMVDAVNSVLDDIGKQTAYDSVTKTSGLLSGEASLRAIRDQLLSAVTNGIGGKSLAAVGIQVDRNGRILFDEAKFQSAYAADPSGVAKQFAGTATYAGSGTVTLQSATWRTQAGSYSVSEANGTLGMDSSGVPLAATRSGSILTGAAKTPVDGLSVTCSAGAAGTITYQRGFASALEAVTQIASNSTNGTLTSSIQNRNDGIKRMNDDIDDWDVRLQVKQQSLQRQYAALEVALGKLQDQASWLSGQISSLPKMSS